MKLKKITQEKLNKMLDKHEKWISMSDGNCLYLESYDLQCLDFSNRNLVFAQIINCDCTGANFSNCLLWFANFCYSDLTNIIIDNSERLEIIFTNKNTRFNYPMICPEHGEYIAYKKCRDNRIVKLLIPEDTLRSSAFGNKCRTDKATVLDIYNYKTGEKHETATSLYNYNFIYKLGETMEITGFDTNRWNECSVGIHHFMSEQEAIEF